MAEVGRDFTFQVKWTGKEEAEEEEEDEGEEDKKEGK